MNRKSDNEITIAHLIEMHIAEGFVRHSSGMGRCQRLQLPPAFFYSVTTNRNDSTFIKKIQIRILTYFHLLDCHSKCRKQIVELELCFTDFHLVKCHFHFWKICATRFAWISHSKHLHVLYCKNEERDRWQCQINSYDLQMHIFHSIQCAIFHGITNATNDP